MSDLGLPVAADLVIRSTLILAALTGLYLGIRRASAASRHLVLSLTMLSLLVLPAVSLGLPDWKIAVLPSEPSEAATALTRESRAVEPTSTRLQVAASESERRVEPASQAVAPPVTRSGGLSFPGFGPSIWILLVWATGLMLLLGKLFAGLLRMRWIVRNGFPLEDPQVLILLNACRNELGLSYLPRLVRSDRVEIPVVWGWLRPNLIVPLEFNSWPVDRMRVVLLHELGHLRRADWPKVMLGRIVAALYWFHPWVWAVERCARRECEQACDDLVVACGTKPSDYASHLLSISRGLPGRAEQPCASLALFRRSQLDGRVRSILDPVVRRSAPSRRGVILASMALLALLLPVASIQLVQKAEAAEEPLTQEPDWTVVVSNVQVEPVPDEEMLLAQNKVRGRVESRESVAGRTAYKRAYESHRSGRYVEAIDSFQQSVDAGYREATALYNIACGYAMLGESRNALLNLEKAYASGFDNAEILTRDSDLDSLRGDSEFQAFIDRQFDAAGMRRRGDEHYRYQATMDQLQELDETGSTDGKAWYQVGSRLLSFRKLDMAVDALDRAEKHLGEHGQNAMYNLACAYSLDGNERQALEWLEKAVDSGFNQHERFLNDSDLNNVRNLPGFDRVAAKSEFFSMERYPRRSWERDEYSERRWGPAVEDYRNYVAEHPESGRAWFNLGYALHYSRRFDEAIEAHSRAESLSFRRGTSLYNQACSQAMLGQTNKALDLLERAIEVGFKGHGHIWQDEDLDSLRGEPRFEQMLEQLEERHEGRKWMKREHKSHEKMKGKERMRERKSAPAVARS